MSTFLFDDFNPISTKAWKQKIQFELNGLDYNKTLLWQSLEGITVKPFYTHEDRFNLDVNLPTEPFSVCQSIFIDDEVIANTIALDAIKNGANAIEFTTTQTFNYKLALDNINLNKIKIYFNFLFFDVEFLGRLSNIIHQKNIFLNIDPIGNLAKTGNWFTNNKEDFNQLKSITHINENVISIDASLYQNAGANCIQQLAYALAHTNEYLNHFKKSSEKIIFKFAIGNNYFFEIAKLRAFRLLWSSLLDIYKLPQTKAHIFTQPSLRNKTMYSAETNISRTATECLSGILGGANTISNNTYDSVFRNSTKETDAIARNQLLYLKKSLNTDTPQHLANRNYYIENLTHQLAEKALGIFKQIEQGGGFIQQLISGNIQKKINESAEKEQQLFDDSLFGLTNNDSEEKLRDKIETYNFLNQQNTKTAIQPILPKRLSEFMELKRLENE